MSKRLILSLVLVVSIGGVLVAQVNFLNARLVTDSNGSLLVTSAAVGTVGQTASSAANTRVLTDSNNALIVAINGGTATFGDGSLSAPSISFVNDTDTGFARELSNVITVVAGGSRAFLMQAGSFNIRSDTGTIVAGTADDTSWKRLAAGVWGNTTGVVSDTRTSTSVTTDGNATYSAAQMKTGIITRSAITANRVDAIDTAANIVAAFPGAVAGSSFWFVVNNNDDASTITLNGASAGVTYEGTATALAAGDAWTFLVVMTNVTAASEAVTLYQFAK